MVQLHNPHSAACIADPISLIRAMYMYKYRRISDSRGFLYGCESHSQTDWDVPPHKDARTSLPLPLRGLPASRLVVSQQVPAISTIQYDHEASRASCLLSHLFIPFIKGRRCSLSLLPAFSVSSLISHSLCFSLSFLEIAIFVLNL